jgi:predicted RNase H-like HicB family nuclease/predicted RNA binding protein YcfA (HicA-like mRNA interferase family)
MKPDRLLARILRGDAGNVRFADLVQLLEALGFRQVGGRGSHRVFVHPAVVELVNLQEDCGAGEALSDQTGRNTDPAVRSYVGGQAMNTDYRIEVSWDPADQVWVADVPELAFCTAHGPTPHEAVAEVERAVDVWLEAADALGRPAPPPSMPARRA